MKVKKILPNVIKTGKIIILQPKDKGIFWAINEPNSKTPYIINYNPTNQKQMDAITYSKAHNNLTTIMNKVCEDHTPIIITHQSESPVVIMSLEDYNAIEETLYLLPSPKNS